jgi:PAS domain S-box-containing protein
LLEASPVAIAVVSLFENRYLRANRALSELLGIPLAEILETDPFSLGYKVTHPDDLVAEQQLFAELVAGKRRSYTFEKRYVHPDGSVRWGLLTLSGVFEPPADASAPVGALRLAVLQAIDITAHKVLARALTRREEELRHAQKVDGIGRLAAGVAHDFNNLLTVITGYGSILKRAAGERAEPANSLLHEGLDAILEASERGAQLTAQLLAYGRRAPVRPKTLALSQVVAASQRLLARTLESSVAIEQQLDATGHIVADEVQIGQVVMNLVLNARDALPEGGGHIRLVTRDVGADFVELSVSDDGHGMSPEVAARMFEPFFTTRAERAGTSGTGLGLATVQRIVDECGGAIDVKSGPNEGTTVTLRFPRAAGAPLLAGRASVEPSGPAPNSRRILIVEDDPSVRALLGTVLLGASYFVVVTRDGREALQAIETEREPFDLIVTDIEMPSLDGLSLAERLKARGVLPRMLFVSGYSQHAPQELLQYGALLPKPFSHAKLLEAVARALGDAR